MAFATLNGAAVFEGTISIPRVGAWHADLSINSETILAGRATLVIDGGLTLAGTANRSGVWQGTSKLNLVGGADGLRKMARPQHYQQATLRMVLLDLLAVAGEKLAASSDAATLALTFPHWTTMGQSVGRMIGALVADSRIANDVAWRLLPDGSLWVGAERWPDSGLKTVADYQEISESPSDGWIDLGVESPSILPGTALGGRKVSYVEHKITGGAARTRAWFEND